MSSISNEDHYDLGEQEPISPVIKDKFGNIVDGVHRLAENADWPTFTNEAIDTPLALEYARLLVNTSRRIVPAEEISQRLEAIYDETKKITGEYPKAETVAESLGRSEAWVMKYLPLKFKDPSKVEAGQKSGEVRSVQQERTQLPSFTPEQLKIFKKHGLKPIDRSNGTRVWSSHSGVMSDSMAKSDRNYIAAMREIVGGGRGIVAEVRTETKRLEDESDEFEQRKQQPYSGDSRRMSESTSRSDTPAENSLQTLLAPFANELNAHFGQDNNIVIIIGEKEAVYHPDALLDDWLCLEVEGRGSASADNPKREEALMNLDKRLVHIPNRVIKDPDMREVLRQLVFISIEMRRRLSTATRGGGAA